MSYQRHRQVELRHQWLTDIAECACGCGRVDPCPVGGIGDQKPTPRMAFWQSVREHIHDSGEKRTEASPSLCISVAARQVGRSRQLATWSWPSSTTKVTPRPTGGGETRGRAGVSSSLNGPRGSQAAANHPLRQLSPSGPVRGGWKRPQPRGTKS